MSLRGKIAHHRRRRKRSEDGPVTAAAARLPPAPMDDLRKFALYFRPYKKSLVVGVFCILASTVVGVLIPVATLLAVDALGAGVHEKVLVVMEGRAAGEALGRKLAPVDAAVVGIIDSVDVTE